MGRKAKDPKDRKGGNAWKKKRVKVTCPTCNGSGKRGNNTCGLCDGDGTIMALE